MALVKCSECTTEISDQAKACPKCGAPLEVSRRHISTKTGSPWLLVFGILGGLFLFAFLLTAIFDTKENIPVIKAAINYLDSQVIIANKEPVDLRDCFISIQQERSDTGIYRIHHVDIKLRESKILDAELFVNGDSERFNPYKYAPKLIMLECDTANGKRSGGRSFQ